MLIAGRSKKEAGKIIRRSWLSHITRAMGLNMKLEGTPCTQTALFVANHISYVDPIAVLTHIDAHVVAKAEIRKWPLVGLGAHLVGTIFVNREEKSSRHQTANTIREALEQHESILVFPEGTTTAGPGTIPFKPRSFQAAESAGVPVQPIAILYDSPAVAFIGNHTFLPHFFGLFTMQYITGRIAFGPLLTGPHTADRARAWIHSIQLPHETFMPEHERS